MYIQIHVYTYIYIYIHWVMQDFYHQQYLPLFRSPWLWPKVPRGDPRRRHEPGHCRRADEPRHRGEEGPGPMPGPFEVEF